MKYLLLILLLSCFLLAKDHKLELGIATGALYYPNYIGSKSSHVLVTPLPYIRYRGEWFRIDEDGINGELLGIKGLRIDLSISGSLPAQSETNDAREGMPDLDLTGEIGFQLVYKLYENSPQCLEFEFPLRAVLSSDFTNLKYRGIVSNPQLKYSLTYSELKWTFRLGAVFGDENYNNYYYGVEEKYVTPTRDEYSSSAGFAGYRGRVGMTYEKGNWWGGAFVSYFNIKDAVFNESPLVETNHSLYTGISLAYIFYTSD
jgi:outer membrane scaffolding protein for murein synthesis (MipA/OmpV family)